MGRKTRYGLVILLFGAWFAVGCGDIPTCLDVETSLVKINFVDANGKARAITLTALQAINNPEGFPEYADSTLSRLVVPLNPGDTTTTFILQQAAQTDTIGLSYTVKAILISPECGLDAAFDKLDTTFTTFKKLKILSPTIHEEVTVNIEITL